MKNVTCSFCGNIYPHMDVILGSKNASICRQCTLEAAKLCVQVKNSPIPDSQQPTNGLNCEFCCIRNSRKSPILTRSDHTICLECIGRFLSSFLTLSGGGISKLDGKALFKF